MTQNVKLWSIREQACNGVPERAGKALGMVYLDIGRKVAPPARHHIRY